MSDQLQPPREHDAASEMEDSTRLHIYDVLTSACDNVRCFCAMPMRGTVWIDEVESEFKEIVWLMREYAKKWNIPER